MFDLVERIKLLYDREPVEVTLPDGETVTGVYEAGKRVLRSGFDDGFHVGTFVDSLRTDQVLNALLKKGVPLEVPEGSTIRYADPTEVVKRVLFDCNAQGLLTDETSARKARGFLNAYGNLGVDYKLLEMLALTDEKEPADNFGKPYVLRISSSRYKLRTTGIYGMRGREENLISRSPIWAIGTRSYCGSRETKCEGVVVLDCRYESTWYNENIGRFLNFKGGEGQYIYWTSNQPIREIEREDGDDYSLKQWIAPQLMGDIYHRLILRAMANVLTDEEVTEEKVKENLMVLGANRIVLGDPIEGIDLRHLSVKYPEESFWAIASADPSDIIAETHIEDIFKFEIFNLYEQKFETFWEKDCKSRSKDT